MRLLSTAAASAALICTLFVPAGTMAYEEAFSRSPDGEVVVRTLPAGRWIQAEAQGSYFDQSGQMFRKLFDYIKSNEVSMTVPVEGDLGSDAAMRFYLGSDAPPALADAESVEVVSVPQRRVASLGGKGAYSESNIAETRARLEQWLAGQSDWVAAGEPYAVFWNGPFTPWFMKRYEVHVPLQPASSS